MISHSKSSITQNHIKKVADCLNSGLTTAGYYNDSFTNLFAEYLNRENILLFSSGTSALYNLLINLELGIESEVLMPNYICYNVYHAVKMSGLCPILYDNAVESWQPSFETVSSRITNRTKVIILNHIFGQALTFIELLKRNYPEIIIVEDCCHLIAPKSKIGSVEISTSDASFFSFNSTKLLAGGEGGALQLNSNTLYKKLLKNKLDHGLSDLNCSLLIEQLKDYPDFLKKRRQIATYYNYSLAARNSIDNSIYFRFPVLVNNQEQVLGDPKVAFRKGVDQLIHFQIDTKEKYPNSLDVYRRTVSLPIYPSLNMKELETIVERFNSYYAN